jgi:hypothetical protein
MDNYQEKGHGQQEIGIPEVSSATWCVGRKVSLRNDPWILKQWAWRTVKEFDSNMTRLVHYLVIALVMPSLRKRFISCVLITSWSSPLHVENWDKG